MPPLNIFIVEDSEADILLVRESLHTRELAFDLDVAMDAEEAFRCLDGLKECPDLCLLDLNLPRGDGHEVLQAIRRNPICSDIPVVVITSSDSPKDRARVAELGADRYFRKPLDLDEFLTLGSVVEDVLRQRGRLNPGGE